MKTCLFLFLFVLAVIFMVGQPFPAFADTVNGCQDSLGCTPNTCGPSDTTQLCSGYETDPNTGKLIVTEPCSYSQACPTTGNTGQDCNGGGEACGYTTVSCDATSHCGGIGGTCNGQQLEYCVANDPTPTPHTSAPTATPVPPTPTTPVNQTCTPNSTTYQCTSNASSCASGQCVENAFKCNSSGTGYTSTGGSMCTSSCGYCSSSGGGNPTPVPTIAGGGGSNYCQYGGAPCFTYSGNPTTCGAGEDCSSGVCAPCGSGGGGGGGGGGFNVILGTVYGDANYNGTQESRSIFSGGESGVNGVLIVDTYSTPSYPTTNFTAQQSTEGTPSGGYSFPNGGPSAPAIVQRTTSSIRVVPPAGYIVTTQNPISNITPGRNQVEDFGIAPGFTISGNVYLDTIANGKKDPAELNYNGAPVTISYTPITNTCASQGGTCMTNTNGNTRTCAFSGGSDKGNSSPYTCGSGQFCCLPSGGGASSNAVATSSATANGAYTSPALSPGQYTVSMSPPTGYTMSYPKNGSPPSFQVTVGNANTNYTCSTDTTSGSSCTPGATGGSIINLNFGLTGGGVTDVPWFQVNGLDARLDDGLSNSAPSTANSACGAYTAGSGGYSNPGVLYTGDTDSDFGTSQPSTTNWVVGGSLYPEVYEPGEGEVLSVSYSAVSSKLTQSNITPTDMTTISGCSVLTSCTLPANLPNGVYKANGDLTLTGAYTFPANKNYVFLVNGDLDIKGNVIVPNSSTATFIASGDVTVDKSVGTAPACPPTGQVEGIYVAGRDFVIDGYNDPTNNPDSMLGIQGTIVTNAELGGGSLISNRDLGTNDTGYPAFTITARPDFTLHLPELLKETLAIQQEIAP